MTKYDRYKEAMSRKTGVSVEQLDKEARESVDARYKRRMRNQERRIRRERKKQPEETAPLAVATWLRHKPRRKP